MGSAVMPLRGDLGLATGLRSVADGATSAAVAVLTVIAVVVLAYGLGRAIIRNRRPQIVVADIACSGNAELADASALSQVLRRCIRGQIDDQRSQVARIGQSILLPASRALDIRLSEVERIQHAATDSVSAVLSTLRAVAPESSDRFINVFALILPPPRGISVNVTVIRRGMAAAPRLGACAELNLLDGRLLSSAVFWEPFPAAVAQADETGAAERVLALLEPVTRWVAVHLVLTLMVSPRRRIPRKTQQGLRRLLAGGLFLQAMRDYFPDHAPAFGEEALTELEHACRMLPQTPLAVTTLAGVHERIGWARRDAGQPEQALDAFRAAVSAWRDAERLTAATVAADDASRALVVERRLKAQLASGDAVLSAAALAELRADSLLAAHPAGRAWRYNRACLYAQAYRADPLTEYLELALKWLGLALLREMDSSLWEDARQRDPELTPVREALGPFLLDLRAMIPAAPDTMSETDAEELVAQVMRRHSHALCAGLLLWCRMYLRVRRKRRQVRTVNGEVRGRKVMTRLLGVFAVGCVVAVLAACGGSSPKTPSASASASAATPASLSQLKKIVLQTADLPAGWKGAAYQPDPNQSAEDAALVKCVGARDTDADKVAEANSDDFSLANATISSSATSYRSQSDLTTDVAILHSPRVSSCFEQMLKKQLATALPGATFKSGSLTITPGSAGGPANVVAAGSGTFKIEYGGQLVPVYLTVAFITGPLIEAEIDTENVGQPVAASVLNPLVAAVATRAAKG